MARTGRKPMAARHVDRLQGSDRARLRLKLILECMLGNTTVAEACEQLGIGESRFHAMRNQWLQESLEFLEPRRTGRPPKEASSQALKERIAELEAANRELQQQLLEAEVRLEVAQFYKAPTEQRKRRIAAGACP